MAVKSKSRKDAAPAKKTRKPSAVISLSKPERGAAGDTVFPVVGIGASAGGFEAIGELLRELPADTGMAFVVVQHLDPSHVSLLAELLGRHSRMPVTQVRSGMKVEPNQVYVIPPNARMIIERGVLRLSPRLKDPGPHMPIDLFLSSLARDRKASAIGIILSGTASDGTQGITAVKAEGGLTFAQDFASAKFPDMPRNAVASGAVDLVLTPVDIAGRLTALVRHSSLPEVGHGAARVGVDPLTPIFQLLRARSGVDFSLYKRASVERRIARNMVLRRVDSASKYAQLLKKNPADVDALSNDLLITVTHFFREPPTFAALKKKVFPAILKSRKADAAIRIWIPGCATGEEVYSIAIVLLEFLQDMVMNTPIQIFGTDLSERAIDHARAGVYSRGSLQGHVSPDRLRRFFNEVDGGYQISGAVRDLCIFARHNLVEDPPFSRLDLVSCRNVLIYLGGALQKRALNIFYYALKPDGFLTLGSSESLGPHPELFSPADKTHKIFCRKNAGARPAFFLPPHPAQTGDGDRPHPPKADSTSVVGEVQREADRVILGRFAPAGALVHQDGTILQFRGHTGHYLEPAAGEASLNLLRMAREGLGAPLRAAFAAALKKNVPVIEEDIRLSSNGTQRSVTLRVIPLHTRVARDRYLLVLFEDAPEPAAAKGRAAATKGAAAQGVRQTAVRLKQELASVRGYLQSIIEEREAANEELKSANEEVQSSNEEIQSANEELETAKEELQSANEELITLNDELQTRNTGLSVLNNDLVNLLGSVNIPIVMLNQDLRIRRFTPLAEKVLNLIPSDVGRPMRDIQPNIEAPDLEDLFLDVLRTLEVREREVQDRNGAWHLLRIRPYKTTDNKIDGAVLALVEIDAIKRSLEQTRSARDFAEATLETVQDSLVVLNSGLCVISANRAFYQTFRIPREETEGRHVYDLDHSDWNFPELRAMLEEVVSKGVRMQDLEVERDFNRFGPRTLLLNARPFRDGAGGDPLILLAISDITDRKQTVEARYRRLFETAPDGILVVDGETGRITDVNPYAVQWLGYPRNEVLGKRMWTAGVVENAEAAEFAFREIQEKGSGRYDAVELRTKDGKRVEAEIIGNLYTEGSKKVIQFNVRDVTERRRVEEQVRSSLKEKEVLLQEIHHRVKNNLQVITSLLSLQSRFIQDRQALRMFDETRNRVKSIAVVHELLYQSSGATITDLRSYISRLAENLFEFYGADRKTVRLLVEVGDVALMLDKAIPCGLILNELISNCLKHAFADGAKGEINVSLVRAGERYVLRVRDTGRGFQKGLDLYQSETLGLQLVNILTDQLGGTVSFHASEPTEVAVEFPASARKVN